MVTLNKIYTRTGDDGTTGLGTATRVRKDAPRVGAYGDVDEANAAIGLAVAACDHAPEESLEARIGATLANNVCPRVTAWVALALLFDEPPERTKVLPSAPVTVLVLATAAVRLEFW